MLLERIEHELLDHETGIINSFELIPDLKDCWEISNNKHLIFIYRYLCIDVNFKHRQSLFSRFFQKNK